MICQLAFLLCLLPRRQGVDFMALQYSPVLLLVRQDVRKELKLTKDQSKTVEGLVKSVEKAGRDSQKDPMASFTAINKANEEILGILNDPQKSRLNQIRWQAMGINCVLDQPLTVLLALTEDQVAAVKESKSNLMNSWLDQARSGRPDQKKLDKLGKEHEDKVSSLLTAEQRIKLKELLGQTFRNARPKGMPPF